jgi:hypothetical protein
MLYILKEPAACYFLSFRCCTLYYFVLYLFVSPVLVCVVCVFYYHFNCDELMLHERRYYKENNSKACNGMPKYNIISTSISSQHASIASY